MLSEAPGNAGALESLPGDPIDQEEKVPRRKSDEDDFAFQSLGRVALALKSHPAPRGAGW